MNLISSMKTKSGRVFLWVKKLGLKLWKIRDWAALGVLMTLLAVLSALFGPGIRDYYNRPKLEISFFEPSNLHLHKHTGARSEIDKKTGKEICPTFIGLFITIKLKNTGKRVAYNTQAFLTNIYYKDENKNWVHRKDWMPVQIRWVIPPLSKRYIFDLTQKTPCLLDLGSFSKIRSGKFLFNYLLSPIDQIEKVGPGKHCFEVNFSAEGADVETKYFYVNFNDFSGVTDFEKIKDCIKKVEMRDHPPL